MNFQRLSAAWVTRGEQIRAALAQLPMQARSVLIGAVLIVTALTLLALSNIFGWWISHVADISATKPRISRLLGYIDAAPRINATLAEVDIVCRSWRLRIRATRAEAERCFSSNCGSWRVRWG